MARNQHRSRTRFRVGTASAKTAPLLEERPVLPWPLAAVGGGAVAALAGGIGIAGVCMLGWWGSPDVSWTAMLSVSAKVWLLAHGGALDVEGLRVTIVPLALTALLMVLVFWAAAFALRQGVLANGEPPSTAARRRLVGLTAAGIATGYLAGALLLSSLAGTFSLNATVGALALSFVIALLGGEWQTGARPDGPLWVQSVARGALVSVLALVGLSAVVLGAAMILGEPRIGALETSLGLDGAGVVVWSAIALFYLPNILAWAAAWMLGAGFVVGEGTTVAPWTTQLGLLPNVPLFGGLPADGSGGMEGWLVAGVIAGFVGGAAAVRVRPVTLPGAIRIGFLAGIVSAAVFLLWALVSGGALGTVRMSYLGPRWPQTLIGAAILVGSAGLGAIGIWFTHRRVRLDS